MHRRRPEKLGGVLMAKNIVLCSDGTGNRGGDTPDSNVYKMYKIVELNDKKHIQMKFYDNGVGTSTNKYWRALTGATGVGFKRNVCDLYCFLARAYEPGDRVFLVGFSRGAATVRAFSGFVATCGLFKGSENVHESELRDYAEDAFDAYRKARKGRPERAQELREDKETSYGVVPIEMLGVWDTVAALGLPQKFRTLGLLVWLLNALMVILDRGLDLLFPHRFYEMELTDNVRHAYQALAIDDERQSFSPLVWDEHRSAKTDVEQVWFVGAHSNVGGGYGRRGLSSVSLEWMMRRAENLGLHFERDAFDEVRNEASSHGRLVDSRDGFAIYYRYQARDIEQLSAGKLRGKIKIHRSVLERIQRRTANYAPGLLPYEFEVVETDSKVPPRPQTCATSAEEWKTYRDRVSRWILRRARLYNLFIETSLLIVIAALYLWKRPPVIPEAPPELALSQLECWPHYLYDFMRYVLPRAFENLAGFLIFSWPWYVSLAVVVLVPIVFLYVKHRFRKGELGAREDARFMIRQALRSTTSSSSAGTPNK
jgi:hypothetical protein